MCFFGVPFTAASHGSECVAEAQKFYELIRDADNYVIVASKQEGLDFFAFDSYIGNLKDKYPKSLKIIFKSEDDKGNVLAISKPISLDSRPGIRAPEQIIGFYFLPYLPIIGPFDGTYEGNLSKLFYIYDQEVDFSFDDLANGNKLIASYEIIN